MNKSKIGILTDSLFLCLLSFLILFGWCFKIIKNAKFSFFVSNTLSFIAFIVYFLTQLKKYNISKTSLRDKKDSLFYKNFLIYCLDETANKFYENLLNSKHLFGNIYESNNLLYYINIKSELTANDFNIANNICLTKNKSLIFISENVADSFKSLITNSPTLFYFYNFHDMFQIMKEQQIFPSDIKRNKNNNFKTFSFKLKNNTLKSLTKNKFKDFSLSGISLILFSFFIPYSLLYLITGSFLLLLSIICLFNKNQNIITNKEPLTSVIKK